MLHVDCSVREKGIYDESIVIYVIKDRNMNAMYAC